jgi:hypothetical protein
MSHNELKTTNKKVLEFYNNNPLFNFDIMNELFVDVLQEVSKYITGNISNNMSQKLNNTLSLQSQELLFIKEQLKNIINKDTNQDLLNSIIIKLHEHKKDSMSDIKDIISNHENNNLQKIIDLIPKNNTNLINQCNEILKNFKYENNHETYNHLLVSIEKTISNYVNTTENRINTNINDIKNITNQNTITQNKMNTDLSSFLDKYKNSSFKGALAENHIENILTKLFDNADIHRTTKEDQSGDFIMSRNNLPTILFEIKNYNTNVPSDEIDKFIRDINKHKVNGIFISISTGIAKKNNFQIEINDNNNILIYIHNLQYDEYKIKSAVDIIDNLTSKLSLYNHKDITLSQQTIDLINKEYQTLISKKTLLSDHMKDSYKKSISLLEDIELKTLNTFLSTHFSFLQSNSLKCTYCNKFIGTNKKSLSVHQRKCKKNNNSEEEST